MLTHRRHYSDVTDAKTDQKLVNKLCDALGHTTGVMQWDTLQVRCSGTHYRCDAVGHTTGVMQWDTLQV